MSSGLILLLLISSSGAATARWRMLPVPGAKGGHQPLVAVDRDGSAVLIWNKGRNEADRAPGGAFSAERDPRRLPTYPLLALSFLRPHVLLALEDDYEPDYRSDCCDYIDVQRRTGMLAFARPHQVTQYDAFSGSTNLASDGAGRAAYALGGTALTIGLTNPAGRFGAGSTPASSPLFGSPMAAIAGGTALFAWQEHVDAVFDRRGPLTQVVLASSRPGRRLSKVAVAGSAVHGVPGPTAVAGYGRFGAIVAWAANPPGRRQLHIALTALSGRAATQAALTAPGVSADHPVARADGRGGAVVAWQSWRKHRASIVVYLRGAGARQGRVLHLSSPAGALVGPVLGGDGRGHVLVAWIADGVVQFAAGTIADRLRLHWALPAGAGRASELTVNHEPVRRPILAWHDARGIAAAAIRLS